MLLNNNAFPANLIRLGMFLFLSIFTMHIPAYAVIGGKEVDIETEKLAKHLVAIQMTEQENGNLHYYKGSGVIVGRDTILTAAHNVVYIPNYSNISVIFSSTPCWGPNTCGETRIVAKKTLFHPEFRMNSEGTENDLAVIKLSTNVPNEFQPIKLVENKFQLKKNMVSILGFGKNVPDENPSLDSFRLRMKNLSFVNPTYEIGSQLKFWLDQKEGGICGGDSGGPVIVMNEKTPVVIGIASHVIHDKNKANCLIRGAFADVLFFGLWLRDATARLEDE